MNLMSFRRPSMISAALLATVLASGCATKKFVKQSVDPVERRVGEMEALNKKQDTSITDLERSLAATDERVKTVDAKATAAGADAARANQAAGAASSAADTANRAAGDARMRADSATAKVSVVDDRVTRLQTNLDDFQVYAQEVVLFKFNSAKLTDEGKQQLDAFASKLKDQKRFMIEVHGFTDKVGDASYNKTLSAKRAEAVTEYLTANHNVPLYRIFDTGSGEFNAASVSGTPREVRDQSRRVDVKIFVAKL